MSTQTGHFYTPLTHSCVWLNLPDSLVYQDRPSTKMNPASKYYDATFPGLSGLEFGCRLAGICRLMSG
nr:hypothetical protein [Shigella sonnei]